MTKGLNNLVKEKERKEKRQHKREDERVAFAENLNNELSLEGKSYLIFSLP